MSERVGGTVTFVFTDVEGSTVLLKQLGRARYGELLARQQAVVRQEVSENGGEEVDTQGDSFFVAFRSASNALACAVAIVRRLSSEDWPERVAVRVRIGIHTGEAAAAGDRYVGFSVHRAARIGAAAHGGQILLSSSTRELVEDDLPPAVFLRDLGVYRLKDVDRPERITQAAVEGLPFAFPPLRGAELVKNAPLIRRRSLLAAALAGVVAAAVAVPLFALSSGGPGETRSPGRVDANAVGAVSLASGRIVASIPLGAPPNAVAAGGDAVWAAMANRGAVSRVDPATNTVAQTIVTGGSPSAITVGGGLVWVADSLGGKVAEIDPNANGGQQVGSIAVGNGPTGIAYGLGGVWVANSVDGTVVRIDPRTGVKSKPIPVESGADALAVGAGSVWVVSQSAGVVSRIDPAARSVTQTTNVGNQPVAVAAGAGGVWVANSDDGTVSRIDPATGHLAGVTSVGQGPNGVAIAPTGAVWVSNALSGTLSEIDPVSGHVEKTVALGAQPQGIAVSGDAAFTATQVAVGAHRGGTLTLAVANPPGYYTDPLPKSLDPAGGYGEWELLTLTNDGLLGYGRSGGASSHMVVPDLAEALPTVSDGGRTYTFQLRPGIHYSSGAEVRPPDVRRGIERALLGSGGSPPGSYLGSVVGANGCLTREQCDLSQGIVTSAHSNAVVFHLTEPDPDFLYQLALPVYDAVPASTPLRARVPLPATGPYEIAGYQAKPGVIRLRRNPRFRPWSAAAQPDGYPNRIVERYRYSGAAAVHAVENGSADITEDGFDQTWPPAVTASLVTHYSSRLYATPLLTVLGLWLNTRLPPFDDVRVRRALNYAVDRNHLVQINGGSISSQVMCQTLPPNTSGYDPYCPFTVTPDGAGTYNGPDLAKARRLVAESGTKGRPVTIWFYDIPIGHRNGAYFISVLRSLGYKATLKTIPHTGPTWRPDRQAGVGGWGGDYPSASDALTAFSCGAYTPKVAANLNYASFCDPRIDAQVARARTLQTTNPSQAASLWETIDRELTNDAPWVAMKSFLSTDFVSRRTGNYRYCWLSGQTGLTGACLDELWVR